MESKESVALPPPPGLIASLMAGFDAIANHVTAILIPIALDPVSYTHLTLPTTPYV